MCRHMMNCDCTSMSDWVVSLQLVKAGLALGLFGGTHKFLDDKVVFLITSL